MCRSEVVLKWTLSTLSLPVSLAFSPPLFSVLAESFYDLFRESKPNLNMGDITRIRLDVFLSSRLLSISPSFFLSASFSFGLFIGLSFFHHSIFLSLYPPQFIFFSFVPPHCLCLYHFRYLVLVCWVLAMCSSHMMSKCPDTGSTWGKKYTADTHTSSAVSMTMEKSTKREKRWEKERGVTEWVKK